MNTLGYELLSHERHTHAIAVLRLALASHPHSANLYDSLGEALMLAGQRQQPIESYLKAHEMDPTNTHALEMIEKRDDR